ncbi:DnaJ domain-containing protein [Pleurocapsa sp. PCC 7319]|uniref:J domain-containing protein n=1 Tax=Pleurocapsa sp. PCC 7319 TaxID=118161 RepID=UPI0003708575|nr:DnaJ domain-containing protein [Pleurocapsa sp. PCC 7319]
MSFAIKHGLFKLNITDHHAILGVSLDAEPKQIRLRYLKIAQKLHPDKCRADQDKMKTAGQILSKLVNPAYEQLSKKNSFAEHQLVLTQLGNRLAENKSKIKLETESAQELLKAGGSAELVYPKLLKKITSEQYNALEEATHNIGIISELNLVYLMLKCEQGISRSKSVSSTPSATPNPTTAQSKAPKAQSKVTKAQPSPPASSSETQVKVEEPSTESRVAAFVGRAQQYISRGEYDQAITELRDALRIDPNNGIAHAVMGQAYIRIKQLTMAKVHIGKASKADPHNPIVIESKKELDKLTKMVKKSKTSSPNSTQKSASKSGNSGFFSGIFGSKKK